MRFVMKEKPADKKKKKEETVVKEEKKDEKEKRATYDPYEISWPGLDPVFPNRDRGDVNII